MVKTTIIAETDYEQGAALLKAGELVAFPTETVFGLGAIANNDAAVQAVYQVKGRPSDNPLIVHVSQPDDIFKYAQALTPEKKALIHQLTDAFWPGPLTLIVPVKPDIFGKTVTGGLVTVGIRMPDHEATLKMIAATGFPIVGPSANLSGKPSPTKVEHVYHDFNGKIAGILNSPPTKVGVESTVLDLSDDQGIFILRPGAITASMIEKAVPGIKVNQFISTSIASKEAPKAPGMKYRHYSPDVPVYAVSAEFFADVLRTLSTKKIGLVISESLAKSLDMAEMETYSLGDSSQSATSVLFDALRTLDEAPDLELIMVELLPETEANLAYRNRLLKASVKVYE